MFKVLKSWLQLAEIGQSRSSITNPLQWTLVILIGAIVLAAWSHLPSIVVMVLLGCLVADVLLFFVAYIYFMFSKPEVLRSEHYHLSKMAIERGLLGDSIRGIFEEDVAPGTALTVRDTAVNLERTE